MKEFNIDEMEIGSIHIPGRELCAFSQEEFLQKVPNGEILWSHLELLRKCKFGWVTVCLSWRETSVQLECYIEYNVYFVHIVDVLASQDQSGGDATVTIDQRKY